MRLKITISMQIEELERIDERAKELNLTRSAYLRFLINHDFINAEYIRKGEERRKNCIFISKEQ